MSTILIVAAIWIACGVIGYANVLGWFTHRHPYFRHTGAAIFVGMTGPFGLPGAFINCGLVHWRLKPLTKEQAWQAHKSKWPSLSYSDFEESY
jgi:hypothetical protein